jgi:hypothetical protein
MKNSDCQSNGETREGAAESTCGMPAAGRMVATLPRSLLEEIFKRLPGIIDSHTTRSGLAFN